MVGQFFCPNNNEFSVGAEALIGVTDVEDEGRFHRSEVLVISMDIAVDTNNSSKVP